jgi:hypothetical protein
MLSVLGAASSALDLLKSLTAKKTSATPTTGLTREMRTLDRFGSTESSSSSATTKPAPTGSSSQSGALSPDLLNALFAALGQTGSSTEASGGASSSGASNPLKELFAALDADGNGNVSKSEFEDKLGAGGTNTANADSVFGKLDKNGDGSVSLDELAAALVREPKDRPDEKDDSAKASSDPAAQALQGASSTTTTNGDGTVTTSMTYADGSTVSTTSAARSAATNATSSYNFIEQMIAREARMTSSAANALSVSA